MAEFEANSFDEKVSEDGIWTVGVNVGGSWFSRVEAHGYNLVKTKAFCNKILGLLLQGVVEG